MKLIQTIVIGSGGATEINFTNIPQTFTDLTALLSLRSTTTTLARVRALLNPGTGTFSAATIRLEGTGAATTGGTETQAYISGGFVNNTDQTANTFSSHTMYFPNYTRSTSKTISFDCVTENNSTTAYQVLSVNSHNVLVAVNAIRFFIDFNHAIAENSTISLYGITRGSDGVVTTS